MVASPSPSLTPKPERRQHHVRSLSQPLANSSQYRMWPSRNMDLKEQQQESSPMGTGHRAAMYYQICAANAESRVATISREQHQRSQSWMDNQQPPMVVEQCTESGSEQNKIASLIEVATKRLLFHLVKTCAAMPNLFMAIPFLLFALTLLLFFMFPSHPVTLPPSSSSFSSSSLFRFSSDSFLFGGSDPTNGGACIFAQLSRADGRDQFPEDNPAFDAPQKALPTDFAVILSIKSRLDSVLPPSNLTTLAFVELFERIQQISISHQKQIYKWYDVCRQCRLEPVVGHLLQNDLDWTFPDALSRKNGTNSALARSSVDNRMTNNTLSRTKVYLAGIIGDVDLDPTDGHSLRRAHSLLMRVKLKAQLKLPVLASFERRLRRVVSNWTRATGGELDVHFWSVQRWHEEVEWALRNVHLKMLASGALLTIILVLASTRQNAYESRPLLGIQISIVLLLSVFSSYIVHIAGTGLLNPLIFPVPYCLVSIGVLLFSAINSSLDRYSGIAMHPTEKLAFIFIWDGPCLALSLIFLACLCVLSALCVDNSLLVHSLLALSSGFVSLLLFSLFLTVCWLHYAQRVASGLKWFQLCRKGDRAYNEKQIFDYDARTCARLHDKLVDLRPCLSRHLGSLTCNHNFRMIGFALFTVSCFAAVVWSRPRVQLDMGQFVPRGDASLAFLDQFQKAFPKNEHYLELDFEGPLDYEERKEQIFTLLRWALESGLASKSVSWLAEFDKFRKNVEYRVDEDSILPLITHAFLTSEQFRKFSADLRISQGQIHRSRMYLELSDEGRRNSEYLMQQLLSMARQMGLPLVLKAPFSFSPGHDIQVLWRLGSALISVSILSALLNILQPAIALCLLLSNLFLCASVSSFAQHFGIPLNIVTLGTLLYGVLFNSASVLHFAYHFFNAGVRQLSSKQRVEYAFQCTLWPLALASLSSPLCFSLQLLIGQHSPIVFSVWNVICACSLVTLVQTVAVLPGLLILLADYFHYVFTYASQLCDDNANSELTVDPMAENVYFVPSFARSTPNHSITGLGYGRIIYPIEPSAFHSRPLYMPPSYIPPPIDFPRKSPAQHAIQHQRQHSQLSQKTVNNSPRPGSSTAAQGQAVHHRPAPLVYSPPPNRRRGARRDESGESGKGSSRNESLESWSDQRLHRCRSQPPPVPPSSVPQPKLVQKHPNSSARREDEQIYEDPDLSETEQNKVPTSAVAGVWKKSSNLSYSPNYNRKKF